jgi:hypothetical protein
VLLTPNKSLTNVACGAGNQWLILTVNVAFPGRNWNFPGASSPKLSVVSLKRLGGAPMMSDPSELLPVNQSVFQAITDTNGSFDKLVAHLEALQQVSFFPADKLMAYVNIICGIRAELNMTLMEKIATVKTAMPSTSTACASSGKGSLKTRTTCSLMQKGARKRSKKKKSGWSGKSRFQQKTSCNFKPNVRLEGGALLLNDLPIFPLSKSLGLRSLPHLTSGQTAGLP